MKFPDALKGKKLTFGAATIVAGLVAIGIVNADKATAVVALCIGIYTAFVGGHSATDIAVSKTVTKKTEEEAK